mmetsp:Transcript_59305/g.168636  ORF Transcript_59305/g.168636 Transcript_59305/m.168636 type:complete len:200 (+) Transcript_59305:28-627(+)
MPLLPGSRARAPSQDWYQVATNSGQNPHKRGARRRGSQERVGAEKRTGGRGRDQHVANTRQRPAFAALPPRAIARAAPCLARPSTRLCSGALRSSGVHLRPSAAGRPTRAGTAGWPAAAGSGSHGPRARRRAASSFRSRFRRCRAAGCARGWGSPASGAGAPPAAPGLRAPRRWLPCARCAGTSCSPRGLLTPCAPRRW